MVILGIIQKYMALTRTNPVLTLCSIVGEKRDPMTSMKLGLQIMNSLPTNKITSNKTEQSRIHVAWGKVVVFKGENPLKWMSNRRKGGIVIWSSLNLYLLMERTYQAYHKHVS